MPGKTMALQGKIMLRQETIRNVEWAEMKMATDEGHDDDIDDDDDKSILLRMMGNSKHCDSSCPKKGRLWLKMATDTT